MLIARDKARQVSQQEAVDGGHEPNEEAIDMHADEDSEVEALVSSAAEAAENTHAIAGDEGMAEAHYSDMGKPVSSVCGADRILPNCVIPAQ